MLARKLWRDVQQRASQFVSLFLMAFLASGIYAGVGAEWRALAAHSDDLYEQTNIADVFIYHAGDEGLGFDEGQLDELRALPGVAGAERRAEMSATASLSGAPELSLYFLDAGDISRPLVLEGAPFDADDEQGIWLSSRFAEAQGLGVGDRLTVDFAGASDEYTIRGLAVSSEQIYLYGADGMTPDFAASGYAYLSTEAFPAPVIPYTTITLAVGPGTALDTLRSAVTDTLGTSLGIWLPFASHPSVNAFANEVAQHRVIADIFPIVFVLVALLALVTTMSRMITAQRTQIGTLRALGVSRHAILAHYLGYGFWLTLAGASLGIVVGVNALPPLFIPSMSGFYTLLSWEPVFNPSFIIMAAALVTASTAVSWLACRSVLTEKPAQALRPRSPRAVGQAIYERWSVFKRLGFNLRYNLRSIRRNKLRSAMAVIGVLGCTALFVCALGMYDSMGDIKRWSFDVTSLYEAKLSLLQGTPIADSKALAERLSGQLISEQAVEIEAVTESSLKASGRYASCGAKHTSSKGVRCHPGMSATAAKKALDSEQPVGPNATNATIITVDQRYGDDTLFALTNTQLQPFDLPASGIVLTQKIADKLGARAGDTLRWRPLGATHWATSEIAAVSRQPTTQGIVIGSAEYEREGFAFTPTALLAAESPKTLPVEAEHVINISGLKTGWDELTEAMMLMVYIMVAAAAILAVVVLYNLGLLAYTDSMRELSTLKVLGLATGKLRGLLLSQSLWLTALGFLLGIPTGYALLQMILSFTGENYDFPLIVHPLTIVAALIFTFTLAIVTGLLFTRRLRHLDLVSTLKAPE